MEKIVGNGQDKSLPVMSVYFAKENESIWNIGKKYRVSLNDIRQTNQINTDVLNGGERILIAKEMR
jgi:LysM repeat protein